MWSNHPKYHKALDELASHLPDPHSVNKDLRRTKFFGHHPFPKILFICGGDPNYCQNRSIIEEYINKHSKNLLTFRAEYAWETIVEAKSTVNALKLEEWLADFSDTVLILVESFGTVAELGAFSMSDSLRKKLLPILEKKFEHDESFINTGPVRWVNEDSKYGPTIYTDFNSILTSMPIVLSRVDVRRSKIYSSRDEDDTYGHYKLDKKEMLFMVVLVIVSLGPLDEENIIEICKYIYGIKGRKDIEDVRFIISLSVALEIVSSFKFNNDKYYYCHDYSKLSSNSAMSTFSRISQNIRSRCLSHLFYIDEFKKVLEAIIKC
ncbi:retron St85 family effector protein [Photobacterium sp. 1_MG-2023]|uniref:retron St85 family effector protein n=1 Tax=Photobacterium sp. 1_MG-2023 TaxID=3062646 RepID=UPI0026E40644|nr:retron St85 family effector protein [Photobacterium sp. 1_MG-2023]MDO6706749.1 retron St85 family effector protein [Photobacterium sp. 1_MG-2023]